MSASYAFADHCGACEYGRVGATGSHDSGCLCNYNEAKHTNTGCQGATLYCCRGRFG